METQLINVDSKFRNASIYNNPAKFKFDMDRNIKNVKSIRVSSIELPNIFYVFSKKKNNISFFITYNIVQIPIVIEEGSYTSDLLLFTIQTILNCINDVHGSSFSITFDEIKSKVIIKNKLPFALDFSNDGFYDNLGNMLGFVHNNYTSNTLYMGESVMNVVGDNYIFLKVNNYGLIYNSVANTNVLAKIILNKNKGSVVFDNAANFLTKEYIFRDPVNIFSLNIELIDSKGRCIDMLHQNFSMTFEITVFTHKNYESNNNFLIDRRNNLLMS